MITPWPSNFEARTNIYLVSGQHIFNLPDQHGAAQLPLERTTQSGWLFSKPIAWWRCIEPIYYYIIS